MRFMILLKADRNTDAGVLPDQKLLAEMGARMAENAESANRDAQV